MLRIGPVKIEHPFVQAALSGYSDLPMRRVARMHGAAYALNQVILGRTLQHDGDWQRRVLDVPADDHPVAAQLMGSEPDEFAEAAAALADAGYDVVDINFGCPVHKVMRRCRGGYLLSVPREALAIVRRVLDGVAGRVPVTLKMRRGLDDRRGGERDFFTILDGAFAMGVAAVTVHGRTVVQRYAGPSDWGFLARVKRHAGDATVLGSGDLFAPSDCLAMMEQAGVDGVTIARGALGNPWIFNQCRALAARRPLPKPPSLAEQRRTIVYHYDEAVAFHGRERAGKIMRRFGLKYSKLHPQPRRVREAILAMTDGDAFGDVLDHWYDPDRDWSPVRRLR